MRHDALAGFKNTRQAFHACRRVPRQVCPLVRREYTQFNAVGTWARANTADRGQRRLYEPVFTRNTLCGTRRIASRGNAAGFRRHSIASRARFSKRRHCSRKSSIADRLEFQSRLLYFCLSRMLFTKRKSQRSSAD